MALVLKFGTPRMRPRTTGLVLGNLGHFTFRIFNPAADMTVTKYHHTLAAATAQRGAYSQCHRNSSRREGRLLIPKNFKTKSTTTKEKLHRGKGRKLLPFEEQRYVETETLLYERSISSPWHYLGALGVFMCGCMCLWSYNQWISIELLQQKRPRHQNVDSSSSSFGRRLWGKLTTDLTYMKYVSCAWLVIAGM